MGAAHVGVHFTCTGLSKSGIFSSIQLKKTEKKKNKIKMCGIFFLKLIYGKDNVFCEQFMSTLSKILIGSFVLSIVLGAFCTHYLENILQAKQLNTFQLGTRYFLYNILILLPLSLTGHIDLGKKKFFLISIFFSVVLFSGSLWLLAFKNFIPFLNSFPLGSFTPIGGLCMMFSYLFLIIQKKQDK
ncbi:MAG: hypothetical protein CNE98_05545 [Bacteroidetes bacterium MED-G17]|nr:MAG: hypothetical protein CNE98_05545 [Bacteroidetes bacterium MED-G17]